MKNTTKPKVNDDSILSESLKQAKELVKHLEDGNVEQADNVINKMYQTSENTMFHELGKLTREMHETMNAISTDVRVNNVMQQDMQDARHDLSHVINLTEDAANQTLTAIENSTPLLNNLSYQAVNIKSLLHQRTDVPEKNSQLPFPEKDVISFLDKVSTDVESINKNMNTITVAQGFQDLSGQIIQRVSKMVQDVEHSLVSILKVNSHRSEEVNDNRDVKNNAGYGPSIPGSQNNDVLNNQDEVDDLLSTLGF